jgi:hypothetical protein
MQVMDAAYASARQGGALLTLTGDEYTRIHTTKSESI